ncbi:ABC transporter ATP-binding protein [Brevibacillus humidisoli]|uniref:ABC transporter ATP-binding protein n=1 Tax=Brevibacillus humidisoli TaxID=2895522 RepID=UPI001E642C07|nr:ABC transporter ATP-binding protein [Brevibacillus humidisoli]UFJ40277.1 ABC transporter ATP-binding protein [Brevibacillus humidisoli]
MTEVALRSVSKLYGKQQAVQDISVDIRPGEFFVLVGPSGCGKSTTLRMIAGLEEISSGQLLIDGVVMNHVPPSKRRISMVFQNYALYPHMTVKENILFGLQVRRVQKEEQRKRLQHAAEMLGIANLLNRKPRELSGGQRQRVALGRAIVSQHPICLMDEPLSNLDAKLRGQMRSEIRQLQQSLGITMIYVTHDQVEAMTMGDRLMILRDGQLQQVGKPLEVYNQPANLFVAQFMGAPPMNTVNGVWRQQGSQTGIQLVEQEVDLFIPLAGTEGFTDGTPVVLGIRPESLLPATGEMRYTNHHQLCVTVRSVELLGSETIVGFMLGRECWKAKWNGQWPVKVGEVLDIVFAPEQIVLFDQQSGERLPVQSNDKEKIELWVKS